MLFCAFQDLEAHLCVTAHGFKNTGLEEQECHGILLGVLQISLNTIGTIESSIIFIILS